MRPELPGTVNLVLARALAKEPDDRYDSCGAFADALREALGLEPYDSSRPPGAVPTLSASRSAATAPLTLPPDSPPTKLLPGSPSPSLPPMASLPSPHSGSPSRPAAAEPGPPW